MNTLRKFITYYSPYKTVFFIDLLCAAFISIVDLAYPQILRVLTNTLFTKDSSHPSCAPIHCSRTSFHVSYTKSLQILCKLPGTYDGRLHGT